MFSVLLTTTLYKLYAVSIQKNTQFAICTKGRRLSDYDKTYQRNRVDWLYQLGRHPKLSVHAKCVGLLIGTFVNPGARESIHPSYDWLMKHSGIRSRATISKAIKELAATDMLVVWRNQRIPNHYSMPFDGSKEWVKNSQSSFREH